MSSQNAGVIHNLFKMCGENPVAPARKSPICGSCGEDGFSGGVTMARRLAFAAPSLKHAYDTSLAPLPAEKALQISSSPQ
jgi:hypothetical protein